MYGWLPGPGTTLVYTTYYTTPGYTSSCTTGYRSIPPGTRTAGSPANLPIIRTVRYRQRCYRGARPEPFFKAGKPNRSELILNGQERR